MTDSDTLRLLQDAAHGFAKFDANRVRAWRGNPPYFDRGIWQEMAAQGWFGILVDEDAGGLGLGLNAAAIIARVLGAAASPEPFVAAGVVTPLVLARCPAGEQRNAALDQVVSGETIASFAWQGSTGGLNTAEYHVEAIVSGSKVSLNGEARFVPVPNADAFIVAARNATEPVLYWLPAQSSRLTVKTEPHADGSASGWLTMSGVEVASSAVLASGDRAQEIIAEAIDFGLVANCADLIGSMDRALDLTLEYLKTRQQFGQPIGAFQVLQHRAVDLWMQKEIAVHTMNAAIRTVGRSGVDVAARTVAASSAKARIGEVARLMSNETVQLHGAMGFTDEYDLSLYVNRMLALVPYFGNAAEHRARYDAIKQTAHSTIGTAA